MTHLAIIADGNRRWAQANNLPLICGHVQGLCAIERCCDWAITKGIPYLTIFTFSTENWNRKKSQVDELMNLAYEYFSAQREWYITRGIRVQFQGRRDRIPEDLVELMGILESQTNQNQSLILNICTDYGSRDEILRAFRESKSEEEFITQLSWAPDPEVILRTGGRKRLSNFLLWQSAYSELFFSDTLFPALEEEELDRVLETFYSIQRNFGK